ncbi:MAG: NACHT domain-containing NTPase [Phycisphaerae bacterium]
MRNYIDLRLKQLGDHSQNFTILKDAIEANYITIVLGAPGSGKSSLLRKYKEERGASDTVLLTVKKYRESEDYNQKTLLIDGLDEYRSVSPDKTTAVEDLANKLLKSGASKIVIACREMDWYQGDEETLSKELGKEDAKLYKIQPLNNEEISAMAGTFEIIKDQKAFVEMLSNSKFDIYSNPQMFYMLAETFGASAKITSSKKDLYFNFIQNARETNTNYVLNSRNSVPIEWFKEIVGYMASFYILSGIEKFDDNVLDQIEAATDKYPKTYLKEDLKAVLNSKIFADCAFSHRTIAEFALALYLCEQKLNDGNSLSKERLCNFFVSNTGKIPAGLRGTYAWLCCISGDEFFFEKDPYYLAVQGDNTLFSTEQKKQLLKAVRQHSESNPYFCRYHSERPMEGFYETSLDAFLLDELSNAPDPKNHYELFLLQILRHATSSIEKSLTDRVKDMVFSTSKSLSFKDSYVEILWNAGEVDSLQKLLQKIKDGDIDDGDDTYKEYILRHLYPDTIGYDEIAAYVTSYSGEVFGYCSYLNSTPYEYKKRIVLDICKLSLDSDNGKYLLPLNADHFIRNFFWETIQKYNEGLSVEEIYNILAKFRQYRSQYESLPSAPFGLSFSALSEQDQSKIQELANKLFERYIKDWITDNRSYFEALEFDDLFNYVSPSNKREVFIDLLHNQDERHEDLLALLLQNTDRADDCQFEESRAIAEKIEMSEIFNKWENPPEREWEIKQKEWEEKRKKDDKRITEENDKTFKGMTDTEIASNINALYFVARKCYITRREQKGVSPETLERLKAILKELIYQDSVKPDETTLEGIVKADSSILRAIDIIYYMSSCFQETYDLSEIADGMRLRNTFSVNSFYA